MNKPTVSYAKLSARKQKKILDICSSIILVNKKARREGILSLEENLSEQIEKFPGKTGLFMHTLLMLIIDGKDPEFIEQIADNYILYSCNTRFQKLSFELIKKLMLMLQRGTDPIQMIHFVSSYVPIEKSNDIYMTLFNLIEEQ